MKKRIVKLFKIYMILFLCLQVLFPLHIKAVTYDDELYTEFYLNTMQAHGFNPEDTDKFYVEDVNSPNNGYSIYQNKSNLRLTGDKDITFMDCSGGTFQVFVNGERVLLNPPYDVNDPIYETNYYGGEFSIHTIDSSTAADKQDYSSPYYEKEFTAQIHKGIKIDEYGEVLEDYALEITRNPANMASMNRYKVTYEANGGKTDWNTPIYYEVGEDGVVHNGVGFISQGRTIESWNTKPDGTGERYDLGEETAFDKGGTAPQKDEEITLYAQWKASYYQIHFDANGMTWKDNAYDDNGFEHVEGESVDFSSKTVYGTNPSTDQKQAPSLDFDYTFNYPDGNDTFVGWSTSKNGKAVILQPNDFGEIDVSRCDLISVCDAEYVANQELINGIPNASKDQTYILYAVWQPIQYYILFEGNTANSGNMGEMLVTYDKVEKLDKNTYQKTGYHFIGWNTQANGSGLSYLDETTVKNLSSLQGDIVSLYAQWSPNHYKVEFDANGGVGSIPVLDMVYDKEKALPSNTLYKDGYIFKGWSTSRNGNIVYQDKESIKNLTTQQNDVVKLYAIWEAIPSYTYIIRYDANGGNGDSFEHVVEVGKDVVIDDGKKFSKENHTFIGWSTVAKVNDFYRPGYIYKDLAPAGHTITLYAQWSKNTVDDSSNKPSTDGNESTEDQPNHPNTDGNGSTEDQPNHPSTDGNESTEEQPNYPNTDGNESTEEQPNKPNTDAGIGITPNKPTIGGNGIDSQTNGTYEDEKYHNGDNEFTITFVTNDGSYVNTMKVEVGDYIILPDLQDTEPGYVFIGWSTSKNGEVMYKPNQHVYFQDKNNVVLYAQYERISNNVGKQEHGVNTADHTSYYKYIGAFIVSFIVACMLIYKKLSIK